jgi:phosphatidylglycerol:prolipoprotein diacylglycerol transferase
MASCGAARPTAVRRRSSATRPSRPPIAATVRPAPPRHPSQLYEAGLEGALLFLILAFAVYRLKWLQRRGALVATFLIAYGLFRLSLENVRNPDVGMPNFPFGLTMGMMLSTPMILVGGWLLWKALREPLAHETHEPA